MGLFSLAPTFTFCQHYQNGKSCKNTATLHRDKALGCQNRDTQSTQLVQNKNVTTAGDSTCWSSCSCLETACRSSSQEKKMLESSRTIKGPMAMWWSTWSRLQSRGHSWSGRFHHLVTWSQDLGSALRWLCPWQHRTGFESSQDLNISSTKPLMK